MNFTKLPLLLVLAATLILPASACVNTTYSPIEERQITDDVTKLIMGEHPKHSEHFWYHEIKRNDRELEADPDDVEALNDRAVAQLKLKKYNESEQAFLDIESRFPGRYKTASNLGVLYKKTGDYEKAAEHTKKALAIKPSGHLGLGDYYQRMLGWRAKHRGIATNTNNSNATSPNSSTSSTSSTPPQENFLGIPHSASPEEVAAHPLVNKEHLLTLIKADRHFADVYAVLGDVLAAEGDLTNALRAYQRAIELDEGNTFYQRRYADTFGYEPRKPEGHDFAAERQAVELWLEEYQSVEIFKLSERDPDQLPPLAGEVLKEMTARNIATPVYTETIYKAEKQGQGSYMMLMLVALVVFVVVPILGVTALVLVVRKFLRSRRVA